MSDNVTPATLLPRWIATDDVERNRGCEGSPHDPHPVLGPCPCDECPSASKCGELRMCCRSFAQYIDGTAWQETPRLPSRRRYVRVYADATVDGALDDERAAFASVLTASGGNIREAARRLKLRFWTAHGRARRWGLLAERRGYSALPKV